MPLDKDKKSDLEGEILPVAKKTTSLEEARKLMAPVYEEAKSIADLIKKPFDPSHKLDLQIQQKYLSGLPDIEKVGLPQHALGFAIQRFVFSKRQELIESNEYDESSKKVLNILQNICVEVLNKNFPPHINLSVQEVSRFNILVYGQLIDHFKTYDGSESFTFDELSNVVITIMSSLVNYALIRQEVLEAWLQALCDFYIEKGGTNLNWNITIHLPEPPKVVYKEIFTEAIEIFFKGSLYSFLVSFLNLEKRNTSGGFLKEEIEKDMPALIKIILEEVEANMPEKIDLKVDFLQFITLLRRKIKDKFTSSSELNLIKSLLAKAQISSEDFFVKLMGWFLAYLLEVGLVHHSHVDPKGIMSEPRQTEVVPEKKISKGNIKLAVKRSFVISKQRLSHRPNYSIFKKIYNEITQLCYEALDKYMPDKEDMAISDLNDFWPKLSHVIGSVMATFAEEKGESNSEEEVLRTTIVMTADIFHQLVDLGFVDNKICLLLEEGMRNYYSSLGFSGDWNVEVDLVRKNRPQFISKQLLIEESDIRELMIAGGLGDLVSSLSQPQQQYLSQAVQESINSFGQTDFVSINDELLPFLDHLYKEFASRISSTELFIVTAKTRGVSLAEFAKAFFICFIYFLQLTGFVKPDQLPPEYQLILDRLNNELTQKSAISPKKNVSDKIDSFEGEISFEVSKGDILRIFDERFISHLKIKRQEAISQQLIKGTDIQLSKRLIDEVFNVLKRSIMKYKIVKINKVADLDELFNQILEAIADLVTTKFQNLYRLPEQAMMPAFFKDLKNILIFGEPEEEEDESEEDETDNQEEIPPMPQNTGDSISLELPTSREEMLDLLDGEEVKGVMFPTIENLFDVLLVSHKAYQQNIREKIPPRYASDVAFLDRIIATRLLSLIINFFTNTTIDVEKEFPQFLHFAYDNISSFLKTKRGVPKKILKYLTNENIANFAGDTLAIFIRQMVVSRYISHDSPAMSPLLFATKRPQKVFFDKSFLPVLPPIQPEEESPEDDFVIPNRELLSRLDKFFSDYTTTAKGQKSIDFDICRRNVAQYSHNRDVFASDLSALFFAISVEFMASIIDRVDWEEISSDVTSSKRCIDGLIDLKKKLNDLCYSLQKEFTEEDQEDISLEKLAESAVASISKPEDEDTALEVLSSTTSALTVEGSNVEKQPVQLSRQKLLEALIDSVPLHRNLFRPVYSNLEFNWEAIDVLVTAMLKSMIINFFDEDVIDFDKDMLRFLHLANTNMLDMINNNSQMLKKKLRKKVKGDFAKNYVAVVLGVFMESLANKNFIDPANPIVAPFVVLRHEPTLYDKIASGKPFLPPLPEDDQDNIVPEEDFAIPVKDFLDRFERLINSSKSVSITTSERFIKACRQRVFKYTEYKQLNIVCLPKLFFEFKLNFAASIFCMPDYKDFLSYAEYKDFIDSFGVFAKEFDDFRLSLEKEFTDDKKNDQTINVAQTFSAEVNQSTPVGPSLSTADTVSLDLMEIEHEQETGNGMSHDLPINDSLQVIQQLKKHPVFEVLSSPQSDVPQQIEESFLAGDLKTVPDNSEEVAQQVMDVLSSAVETAPPIDQEMIENEEIKPDTDIFLEKPVLDLLRESLGGTDEECKEYFVLQYKAFLHEHLQELKRLLLNSQCLNVDEDINQGDFYFLQTVISTLRTALDDMKLETIDFRGFIDAVLAYIGSKFFNSDIATIYSEEFVSYVIESFKKLSFDDFINNLTSTDYNLLAESFFLPKKYAWLTSENKSLPYPLSQSEKVFMLNYLELDKPYDADSFYRRVHGTIASHWNVEFHGGLQFRRPSDVSYFLNILTENKEITLTQDQKKALLPIILDPANLTDDLIQDIPTVSQKDTSPPVETNPRVLQAKSSGSQLTEDKESINCPTAVSQACRQYVCDLATAVIVYIQGQQSAKQKLSDGPDGFLLLTKKFYTEMAASFVGLAEQIDKQLVDAYKDFFADQDFLADFFKSDYKAITAFVQSVAVDFLKNIKLKGVNGDLLPLVPRVEFDCDEVVRNLSSQSAVSLDITKHILTGLVGLNRQDQKDLPILDKERSYLEKCCSKELAQDYPDIDDLMAYLMEKNNDKSQLDEWVSYLNNQYHLGFPFRTREAIYPVIKDIFSKFSTQAKTKPADVHLGLTAFLDSHPDINTRHTQSLRWAQMVLEKTQKMTPYYQAISAFRRLLQQTTIQPWKFLFYLDELEKFKKGTYTAVNEQTIYEILTAIPDPADMQNLYPEVSAFVTEVKTMDERLGQIDKEITKIQDSLKNMRETYQSLRENINDLLVSRQKFNKLGNSVFPEDHSERAIVRSTILQLEAINKRLIGRLDGHLLDISRAEKLSQERMEIENRLTFLRSGVSDLISYANQPRSTSFSVENNLFSSEMNYLIVQIREFMQDVS